MNTEAKSQNQFKYEIDLAEYVRTHAETILEQPITDQEIEHVIQEFIFENNGIHETVYESICEYANVLKEEEGKPPLPPPVPNCVRCSSCTQVVPLRRLNFLKQLRDAFTSYYRIEDSEETTFEVSIRIDGEVIECLLPEAFCLIQEK